jgi:hypothetical protein
MIHPKKLRNLQKIGPKFSWGLKLEAFTCSEINDGLSGPHTNETILCQKVQSWDSAMLQMDRRLYLLKTVLESNTHLLSLASKNRFTEWCAKPFKAPDLICLPRCAI